MFMKIFLPQEGFSDVCNIVTNLRIEERRNGMNIELMEILLHELANTSPDCHCSW